MRMSQELTLFQRFTMTTQDWEQQLIKDGYTSVTLHKDPPDFKYPEHDHPVDTAYVALKGSMVVKMAGKDFAVEEGQRIDIGKQVIHEACVGKEGCSFLIGVKV